LHAVDTNGVHALQGSVWSYSDILRCRRDPESIVQVLENHIARGLVTADRPLELVRNEWSGALGWKENPTFTIAEAHRYRQDIVRLGDYKPQVDSYTALKETV